VHMRYLNNLKKMKYILLAFIAIIAIQCQLPAHDPANSNCAASYTCVVLNGLCGNATGADPKKYCGDIANFCDWGTSGNCIARYPVGHACNFSVYYGQDCASYNCSNSACAPATPVTTAPAPTVAYAYETNTCSLSTGPFCVAGLSCIGSGSTCQKYFTNGASCLTSLDCTPGNACVSGSCAAQTSTAVIGAACTKDTDCNSQITNAQCICTTVGTSTAGLCGVPDAVNGLVFTAAAVKNCQALVNQFTNMGTITASNSATAASNFACVEACVYTNGPSAVSAAWAGYNHLFVTAGTGSVSKCVYTPPTTCSNPTTTGAKKASATSVVASLFLTVFALLF